VHRDRLQAVDARTMKVVEFEISVAMAHCSGTPSSRVASSVCTVAFMAASSCCFRYRYALQPGRRALVFYHIQFLFIYY